MKIPERDVTDIFLNVYLRLFIDIHWTGNSPIKHKVNLIQLKTFELEYDVAQYIQYTDVRIADFLLGPLIPSTG